MTSANTREAPEKAIPMSSDALSIICLPERVPTTAPHEFSLSADSPKRPLRPRRKCDHGVRLLTWIALLRGNAGGQGRVGGAAPLPECGPEGDGGSESQRNHPNQRQALITQACLNQPGAQNGA